MTDVLPLTPELLAELGAECGGCDFTDASQIDFLSNMRSCDVQAAPGNGKTTLLAAKLALLSRSWISRQQGVCVITHTNAARTEVEVQAATNRGAARLMAYPHFTGTVTAFINQYLALPYLRGLGWHIRQIDDDAFAAEALRRYPSWWALKSHASRAKATVDRWVAGLDLDPSFDDSDPAPNTLAVRRRKGQHGANTHCGTALAELKAVMVRAGIYRYADMTAIAWRALAANPTLADRLRARFPLVILDEAQDTHGEQLRLLEHLFKQGKAAFQRLGDSNQTLYDDDATIPAYWTPGSNCIPLDTSRRFGNEIAAFASRLTVRRTQEIVGAGTRPDRRVLFLFDQATIGAVLGAFGAEARLHWGDTCSKRDIRVVASRHNIPGNKKGTWQPKSLVDYHPAYRSEAGTQKKADLFCRQLQKATVCHAAERPPADVAEMLASGLAGLLHAKGWKSPSGRAITAHNIWVTLAHRDIALPRKVRRLLRDHVLASDAAWQKANWLTFLEALQFLLAPDPPEVAAEIEHYCGFIAEQKTPPIDLQRSATKELQIHGITLRLGSIHSVKGKTVDGVLVVESEVWKGPSAGEQCIDLTTVLPRAFGINNDPLTDVALTAATNVFVAVTRPREVLGLAMRKATATPALIAAAEEQGWKFVDLVSSDGK